MHQVSLPACAAEDYITAAPELKQDKTPVKHVLQVHKSNIQQQLHAPVVEMKWCPQLIQYR